MEFAEQSQTAPKKRKGQEPKQSHKHHPHAVTPQQLKGLHLHPWQKPHKGTTTELNTLNAGEEGSQEW